MQYPAQGAGPMLGGIGLKSPFEDPKCQILAHVAQGRIGGDEQPIEVRRGFKRMQIRVQHAAAALPGRGGGLAGAGRLRVVSPYRLSLLLRIASGARAKRRCSLRGNLRRRNENEDVGDIAESGVIEESLMQIPVDEENLGQPVV